jgi:NitT/TauT family transport system permease protein
MTSLASPPPAESARPRLARLAVTWLGPLVTAVGLVAAWALAVRLFDWPVWLVPSPEDVWRALVDNRSLLPHQTWVTLVESVGGFGLAVLVGIPVALGIASSRLLERTVYPILLGLNAVPKIAIAPILILWMGFGYGPKVAVSFLLCVFPVVISTATGLRSTPSEIVELSRSLCASRWQAFVRFRFPWALPQVFVGLKVAISLAVIGAVIGEFVGASEGLGWVIVNSGSNVNTALAFGAMAILAALSVVLFYAIVAAERLLLPWAERMQQG